MEAIFERRPLAMIQLTEVAVNKVKEAIAGQDDTFAGIRVAVIGGGCSGFQYTMNLERDEQQGDQIVELDGLKVFVDEQSMLYLDGTEIDYVETVQGAGFKFNNPNVTGTCGCGESFQA
jgi:iron-sulfur cluster assembly accessory protein